MNSNFATRNPARILVRGVNWLGDAVMTIPALQRLREQFPEAHIAVLTADKLAELWPHCSAVDETIAFSTNEGLFGISRKLREKHFDLAVVFPNSPRSAIECWLAGIPRRIGYARSWRNVFLTKRIIPRPDAVKMRKRSVAEIQRLIESGKRIPSKLAPRPSHQMHEFLHLVSALGADPNPACPQLIVNPERIEATKIKFGVGEIARPVFGMNPGAEYGQAKRWPVERFIAAACEVQKKTDCVWLIFGGKGDVELARRIETEARNSKIEIRNVAGQTSLSELLALLKVCRVLLTNDSGPMHLAAALKTPVIVLFGSTSPELTGPGYAGDGLCRILSADAPCSPCFLRECPIDFRCMKGIGVEQVVATVFELTRQC